MPFDFGVDTSVKQKNQNKILHNPCIFSKHTYGNNHVLILLDTLPKDIGKFKFAFEVILKTNLPNFDYDVVVASKLKMTRAEIQSQGIYKFYQENSSEFSSFIYDNTVIMTFGYALQAITLSDALSIECFYDFLYNRPYFYAPRVAEFVFPVDSVETLFKFHDDRCVPMDSSRIQFMYSQMKYIKDHYSYLKSPPIPKRIKIVQAKTKDDWRNIVEISKKYDKISWDIETDGFSFRRNKVGCVTMSFDGITGFYIPEHLVDIEEFDLILGDKYQIGANKKFDDKFLRYKGSKKAYTHSDILHLGHLLNEMRFNGAKSLAFHYTQHGGYDYELEQYKAAYRPKNYLEIPMLPNYAAQDAIHTFNIEAALQKQLTQLDINFPPPKAGDWKVRELYEKIIIPYVNVFTKLELRGFHVDMKVWAESAMSLQSDILALKEDLRKSLMISIKDEYDSSFEDLFFMEEEVEEKDELQSGKKLGELLERLGWEDLGHTKQGWYKTGDDQLLRWSQLGHEEANLIQKMRSYLTLQKTFIGAPNDDTKGWKPHVVEDETGTRIHPTYKVMLMDTMRNGCGDPNYQQIPSNSKNLGDKVILFKRILTVPDKKKHYLITLDYASAQMRLAAIDSDDPELCGAYRKNPDADTHSKTAFNIFCKDEKFDISEIVIQDGDRIMKKFPHEPVKIIRNGKAMEVMALDVLDSDLLGE